MFNQGSLYNVHFEAERVSQPVKMIPGSFFEWPVLPLLTTLDYKAITHLVRGSLKSICMSTLKCYLLVEIRYIQRVYNSSENKLFAGLYKLDPSASFWNSFRIISNETGINFVSIILSLDCNGLSKISTTIPYTHDSVYK